MRESVERGVRLNRIYDDILIIRIPTLTQSNQFLEVA